MLDNIARYQAMRESLWRLVIRHIAHTTDLGNSAAPSAVRLGHNPDGPIDFNARGRATTMPASIEPFLQYSHVE